MKNILVIGLGLIGGSVGLDLKKLPERKKDFKVCKMELLAAKPISFVV